MTAKKTLRLGKRSTSVQLEQEFWDHLSAAAAAEKISLSGLVDRIRASNPTSTNLASTLRVWCLGKVSQL